jgi:5-oxoprolinase (ATP-hydrolysing)
VAAGNVETSQRIVDTIFGALQTVAASQGTMNNLLIGNDRFGYYETICGGAGAGPGFDGADAVHTHMTNTRLTDPEVLESRYPLRLVRFEIRSDEATGPRSHEAAQRENHPAPKEGRQRIEGSRDQSRERQRTIAALHRHIAQSPDHQIFRGGRGVIREIQFLAPLEVSIISQRRTRPPYGLHGGAPGAAGRNLLYRSDGATKRGSDEGEGSRDRESEKARDSERRSDELPVTSYEKAAAPINHRPSTVDNPPELLPGICSFSAQPGDRLVIETPGGGSWGGAEAIDN